jgi:hypothetical protein
VAGEDGITGGGAAGTLYRSYRRSERGRGGADHAGSPGRVGFIIADSIHTCMMAAREDRHGRFRNSI